MFCTFILISVFVFFRTSFAVLFRNAQLPLMRSKPSTPELYKFHSILLGALPFCKQAAGGTENGEWKNEWHAKLYAIFIWKILNWFYAFSVCTHVCGRKSEGVREREREHKSEPAGCHGSWVSPWRHPWPNFTVSAHANCRSEDDTCSCTWRALLCCCSCSCSGKSSAAISHSVDKT